MIKKIQSELLIKLTKFFLPFMIAGLGFLVLYLIVDSSCSGKLFLLMFAYFIPPLGKESVIPIGVSGGELTIPFFSKTVVVPSIDPLLMALSIAFVDICVALFLVWNYDLAKKIPLIGKFMIKVENIGKSSTEKYGWVKPLRFVGIMLFVMVPFQGSGGLVGSILGRLIGMKPWNTFLAISIGTVSGCLLIACFADVMKSVFVKNFLLGLLILVILIVIVIIVFIYRKTKKN